jgi:hypothetical protein
MDYSRPKINPRLTAEAAEAKAERLKRAAAEQASRFARVAQTAPWVLKANKHLALLGALPPIEDDQLDTLNDLLAYAVRHRDAGRPVAEVRADVLFLARGTRLPLYCCGGVADSLAPLLAEPAQLPTTRWRLPIHLRPRCPRSGQVLWRTPTGRLALCVAQLCHRCGRPVPQGGGA